MSANDTTTSNATTPLLNDDDTKPGQGELDGKTIGIIIGVLLAVLLLTAVVLFILLRRRQANKRHSTQQAGGSGVYAATTAPIDDETKVMLNDNEHELKEKEAKHGDTESARKSSPTNEKATPDSAALVNNDGNVAV